MRVETRPTTTPARHFDRGRAGQTTRQRRRSPHGGSVVRVRFSAWGQAYAYRCDGAASVGDLVEVDSPVTGPTVLAVVGLGRGDYMGPLASCRRVG